MMLLYSSARQFNLISEHVHPPLQPGVHLKSAGLEKWELQTKGRMTENDATSLPQHQNSRRDEEGGTKENRTINIRYKMRLIQPEKKTIVPLYHA